MSGSQRWALGVLIVMVVTEVANLSEVASTFDSAPVFKAVMALGAITLVAALRNPQARARLNRWTVVGAALVGTYFAGQVIAMLDAFDAAAAQEVMWRSVVDLAYLLIILMLIQVTGRPWTVAATAAATVAVLALLTVLNYASGGHQTFGGLALISEAKGELITTARYTGPYVGGSTSVGARPPGSSPASSCWPGSTSPSPAARFWRPPSPWVCGSSCSANRGG
ncbi:hypothetical protein [Mycolicibacterium sp. CBMA 361]|uniref:hypothetical protein n=1 Tax=Mycolicibacterium sp. CBMA 361 TaxID=2606610 RepID=UPI0012DC4CB8|nr:hypothetical protein [Mycolicibacterium sp. CBMA 361]MUM31052.1 hypothetical protein [Mycolicibacterium sp. CBMA 361]